MRSRLASAIVTPLRRPEYTGANRCAPCTALNVAIGFFAGGLTALVSPVAGVAVVAASLTLVYLRGYLVPGTPELTQQYLPGWVLERFGKRPGAGSESTGLRETHRRVPAGKSGANDAAPAGDSPSAGPERSGDRDDSSSGAPTERFTPPPERVFESAGVLTDCGDDLCLTADFEAGWRERLEALGGSPDGDAVADELASLLGVEAGRIGLESRGEGSTVGATVDGSAVGQWVSREALVADTTASAELAARYDRWSDVDTGHRGTVLSTLRVFTPACPACGSAVEFGEESDDGCCWPGESYTVRCVDCDALVYRVDRGSMDAAMGG
jgi:hypothetical protein